MAALPASDEKKQLVSAWNEVVAAIAKPPAAASGAPDALALDQLQRLKAQIDDSVQRALAKNAELAPYGEVLANYEVLLTRTERSLQVVEDAANSPSRFEPPSNELLNAVILVRQALLKHRESK